MPRRTEPDPFAQAIGLRVRAFRQSAGLTLEQLAYESDLGSKGHLSDLEKGLVVPNVHTLRSLAEHLGVLVADLVVNPAGSVREELFAGTLGAKDSELRLLMMRLRKAQPARVYPALASTRTLSVADKNARSAGVTRAKTDVSIKRAPTKRKPAKS